MRSNMMICPVCTVELGMTERQGVEIDSCPQCRGIWLDRGELEKLIERSTRTSYQNDGYRSELSSGQEHGGGHNDSRSRHHGSERRDDHYEDRGQGGERGGQHRRGRSFLSDLFDF